MFTLILCARVSSHMYYCTPHPCLLPQRQEEGHQYISQKWTYRQLGATKQVLGIKPRPSGSAARDFNHWVISPAPKVVHFNHFRFSFSTSFTTLFVLNINLGNQLGEMVWRIKVYANKSDDLSFNLWNQDSTRQESTHTS